MPTYAPPAARCTLLAFKEGLLSAVGHDVKLEVRAFSVTGAVEDGEPKIRATFDATSVAVVCAMRQGAENPGALDDKDKRTIDGYVQNDILETRRFKEIRFESTEIEATDEHRWEVTGNLTLHGRTRTVRGKAFRRGDVLVGQLDLNQPDFAITPFRAMLGTLRIQPVVRVELTVPSDALGR